MTYTKIRKTELGFEFSYRGMSFTYPSRHRARSQRALLIQQAKGNGRTTVGVSGVRTWLDTREPWEQRPRVVWGMEWTPRIPRGGNTKCKCGRKEHHQGGGGAE